MAACAAGFIVAPAATKELVKRAMTMGIENILVEPFALEDLMEKMERVLGDVHNINIFTQGKNVVISLKGTLDHTYATRIRQASRPLSFFTPGGSGSVRIA